MIKPARYDLKRRGEKFKFIKDLHMPVFKPKPNKIKAVSYSLLSSFETCPRKVYYSHVEKLPRQPPNHALLKGQELDKLAEEFIKGNIQGMPPMLEPFADEMRALKRECATPQADYAVTQSWKPSKWDDWSNVWCRANLDAAVINDNDGVVIDYKTGNRYDTHDDQGKLYGTCVLSHHLKVKFLDVEFWYFDYVKKDIEPVISMFFERKELKSLQADFVKRFAKIFRESKWPKKENRFCGWCDYHKKQGGPCDGT